jgi:hypothetical protein
MSTSSELSARIFKLQNEVSRTIQQLQAAINSSNATLERALNDQLQIQQAELTALRNQLNGVQSTSTASSGEVVTVSQQARDDRANTQNPQSANQILEPVGRITAARTTLTPDSTTGYVTETNNTEESGTDDEVRTLDETQSTPAINLNDPGATSNQTAGVGARNDDNVPSGGGATAQQIITAQFGGGDNARITPKPNILDQYASYTYSISWYLLTPDQYNSMLLTQKRNIAGWQLLMQSGGAPVAVAGTNQPGRNQFFDLDYYLDDLEIESLVPLKGTNMAHSATALRFKVTEPNGITLLTNLYRAVDTLYKQKSVANSPNYPMAQYCLVVRFYGYDQNGNLIQVGKQGNNKNVNSTDPSSVVEKFYPFVITNIKFRVANRAIEYMVDGRPIGHFYNLSQDRGTIPFAFGLLGQTVGDVLVGKPVGTTYPTSSGERTTTTSPTVPQPSSAPASASDNDAGNFETPTLGFGA